MKKIYSGFTGMAGGYNPLSPVRSAHAPLPCITS